MGVSLFLSLIQEVTAKRQSKKHRGLNSSEHRVYHVKFAPLIGLESHDLQPISLEEGEGADESTLGSTQSARVPVVGELPLDYQIYQMVDSAGARGMSTVVRGRVHSDEGACPWGVGGEGP